MNNILKIFLVLTLSSVSLSANADYNLTLFGSGNYVTGINDAGQLIGRNNYPLGVRWDGTTAIPLPAISNKNGDGPPIIIAVAINSSGQVAGYSSVGAYCCSATLWNGTTPTDLGGLPGGSGSYAYAINNSGQVDRKSTRLNSSH